VTRSLGILRIAGRKMGLEASGRLKKRLTTMNIRINLSFFSFAYLP
jgi:hypothetical protein